MAPRIASGVLATALMRWAEAEGGFATLIARGDSTAGAILVILMEKGGNPRFLERVLQPDGSYAWQQVGGEAAAVNQEEAEKFLARRRKFDPDLWLIELDIPSAERFAAEMNLTN
jgi:hypothetical protein